MVRRSARMTVCVLAALLTAGLAAACKDEGKNLGLDIPLPPDSADAGGDAISPDGSPVDQRGTDIAVPDVPVTPDSMPPDADAAMPDADAQTPDTTDALTDPGTDPGPDLPDVNPDVPFVPFAGCSKDKPCLFAEQPFCVLFPDSDQGVCVKDCAGNPECPPAQECIPLNPDEPEVGACLNVAGNGEACDPETGTVCKSGLYCIEPPGQGGMCGVYCKIAQPFCNKGYECVVIDTSDPEVDWGACLPKSDLPGCLADAQCAEGNACATLSDTFSGCAAECFEPGQACEKSGMCTELASPEGPGIGACVEVGKSGSICAVKKGLLCAAGLVCASLGAPDGWSRCVAPCPTGECPYGSVCQDFPVPVDQSLCVPVEFAAPALTPCNDQYPCVAPDEACVPVPSLGHGLCAPACGAGCAEGTACQDGGCLHLSAAGEPCLEPAGLLCQSPAVCVQDPWSDALGRCLLACGSDGDCAEPDACVPTPGGQSYCLTPAAFGSPCALFHGTVCDPALSDALCVHLSGDSSWGFCTQKCTGFGTCPALPVGTYPECILKQNGVSYCGFLCGGGYDCPSGLDCSAGEVCKP